VTHKIRETYKEILKNKVSMNLWLREYRLSCARMKWSLKNIESFSLPYPNKNLEFLIPYIKQ